MGSSLEKKIRQLLNDAKAVLKNSPKAPYFLGLEDAYEKVLGLLVEGVPLRNSRVEGATVLAHQNEGSGSLNGQGAKDGSAKSPLHPPKTNAALSRTHKPDKHR